MLRLFRSICGHHYPGSSHPTFAAQPFGTLKMSAHCALYTSGPHVDHSTPHLRQSAKQIFAAGVEAVLPSQMVKDALRLEGQILSVNRQQYTLNKNVHIAAFGKAVIGMVRAAEDVLGDEVIDGIASIPFGIQKTLKDLNKEFLLPGSKSKVKLIEGAKNNLPDTSSVQAATEISSLASKLTKSDILLVMISGGGSALLPSPISPVTLDEKLQVIRLLASTGATIEQLNTVRKNLSSLKGGRLAAIANPAKVIGLILSDVIGDPLDLIASGPTVEDCSTRKDCLKIFQEFGISRDDIPAAILNILDKPVDNEKSKRLEPSGDLAHVNNIVIGSNSIAVAAAQKRAEDMGFETVKLSNAIDGEARHIASTFVDLAQCVCERYTSGPNGGVELLLENLKITREKILKLEETLAKAVQRKKPICIIGAGETTVTIKGTGKGGRNQEFALAASIAMKESSALQTLHQDGFQVTLLSAGTDGQDGPTDAAGAVADLGQVTRASQSGLDPAAFLENNDSYTFYKALDNGNDLVMTGLTGTNVMDLQIVLVHPPDKYL